MPRVCRIIALTLPRADLTGSPGVQQLTSGCHCHGRAPENKGLAPPRSHHRPRRAVLGGSARCALSTGIS